MNISEPFIQRPVATSSLMAAIGLERLVHRSIDRANELYDLPLDPGQPGFQAVVRANTALVSTALTTQTRVDETNLKRDKGNTDVLNELIERIREAKAARLWDDDPV